MKLFLNILRSISLISCGLILSACGDTSNATSNEADSQTTSDMSLVKPSVTLPELPVLSGAHVWDMNAKESHLSFEATHNGDVFTGRVGQFKTAIKLNPEDPTDAEIYAVMSIASLDAGDADRNANLPSQNWFDLKTFPTADFVSKSVVKLNGNQFKSDGILTIKGISKPITLLFELMPSDNSIIAKGGVTLQRYDFKLGEGSDFADESWVKFPVRVVFEIMAQPVKN